MNRDEKGRISPAQSKVARAMSGRKPLVPNLRPDLVGKTMGQMATEQFGPPRHKDPNPGRYSYGGTTQKKYHKKLKVIARGKRDDYRKGQTKGLTETTKRFQAKGIPFKV